MDKADLSNLFLKDPGCTKEISLTSDLKPETIRGIPSGHILEVTPHRDGVTVHTPQGHTLGKIKGEVADRVKRCLKAKKMAGAVMVGSRGDKVDVILKCDLPVFAEPARKSDILPYTAESSQATELQEFYPEGTIEPEETPDEALEDLTIKGSA